MPYHPDTNAALEDLGIDDHFCYLMHSDNPY